jgi:hypothetical protein
VNIEETKKAIEVMQAFVDGKVVQADIHGRWLDIGPPNSMYWDFTRYNYRIKPEPKEIWVNEYENGYDDFLYHDKETAESRAAPYALRKAVRYREVIEE